MLQLSKAWNVSEQGFGHSDRRKLKNGGKNRTGRCGFSDLIWMLESENIRIAGLYDFNLIFGHAKDMQDFGTAFRTG